MEDEKTQTVMAPGKDVVVGLPAGALLLTGLLGRPETVIVPIEGEGAARRFEALARLPAMREVVVEPGSHVGDMEPELVTLDALEAVLASLKGG